MTIPEPNTVKIKPLAQAMQALAPGDGEDEGGESARSLSEKDDAGEEDAGDLGKTPGDPDSSSEGTPPKAPAKGSSKSPGRGSTKGSGKTPDPRGPPPPLPKPLATFNL